MVVLRGCSCVFEFLVCVAVSGTEFASHCTLTLVYQHNLERRSCNMTLGSFGGVSGECVT